MSFSTEDCKLLLTQDAELHTLGLEKANWKRQSKKNGPLGVERVFTCDKPFAQAVKMVEQGGRLWIASVAAQREQLDDPAQARSEAMVRQVSTSVLAPDVLLRPTQTVEPSAASPQSVSRHSHRARPGPVPEKEPEEAADQEPPTAPYSKAPITESVLGLKGGGEPQNVEAIEEIGFLSEYAKKTIEKLQEWLDRNGQGRRFEVEETTSLEALTRRFETIAHPLPSRVFWRCYLFGSRGPTQEGTVLEMLLDAASFFGVKNHQNEKSFAERQQALINLGKVFLRKGVPLTPRLVEIAVDLRAHKIDFPGKRNACTEWGIRPGFVFDAQTAVSVCARGGHWHSYKKEGEASTSEQVWDWLVSLGALQDAAQWTNCPQLQHPGVCALMDRDWVGFKRAVKEGVALDWVDPVSGATLWHFVCIGGTAMIKHCLPTLLESPQARSVVQRITHQAENFGEKAWSVTQGSTALHCAASELNVGAVQALLGLGVPPNVRDIKGRTALHLLGNRWSLKAQTRMEPVLRALLAGGADAGVEDVKGQTVVQAMAAKAPLGALEVLLVQRKQDVGGDAPQQKKALQKLLGRSEEKARALGEQAALSVTVGQCSSATTEDVTQGDSTPVHAESPRKRRRL